jgi:hypothetical protein
MTGFFPPNFKEEKHVSAMFDRGLLPSAARFMLEENMPISSSKITVILNTLKLAII